MIALALLLGLAAALTQAAIVPAFTVGAWAAPVPTCALVAAWSVTLRPGGTWAIVVTSAVVLGVMSVERSGSFLLALLPTVSATMFLETVSPASQNFVARLGRATAAAAVGSASYVIALGLISGTGRALIEVGPQIALGAAGTSLLAAIVVTASAPWRRQRTSIFT